MSPYEILALLALTAVAGFAYYLYRSDTKPRPPGEDVPRPASRPMFGRGRPQDADDEGPRA